MRLAATFATLLAPLVVQTVRAQSLYGSLVGNVTDPTTASVPRANVRITHRETHQVRETQTNSDGSYTFPTIPPGSYEIEISRDGFRTFKQRNIPVTINTTLRVDASLVVGAATESVEVRGQTALLQTDRAGVRSEFTANSLTNLPLPPGRNYELLYVTIPGFTPPANWGPLPTNPSRITTSTVNGASHNAVSLTIDGASARSVWMRGGAAFAPALEAIETVNIVTSSMDAEQGFAGSASISVNIKSGTNNVHGTLFEYNTNNNLTARAFFLPANQKKPKFIQNQFGGAVGGPIKRNELSYFLSWRPRWRVGWPTENIPCTLRRSPRSEESRRCATTKGKRWFAPACVQAGIGPRSARRSPNFPLPSGQQPVERSYRRTCHPGSRIPLASLQTRLAPRVVGDHPR